MPIKIGAITLYSILELAKKLEITPTTLRGYLKKGRLLGQKVGGKWYVTEESLRDFFNPSPVRTAQMKRRLTVPKV